MAPNVKVRPGIPDYSHHISLTNRARETLGLILCDEKGNVLAPKDMFHLVPVDRTALKTSSGNSSYSDFEYPYSPIVQIDWSGGRGQLDFEDDATRYYDSCRVRTGRAGRVFLGPQEQYTTGYRYQDYSVPGNVIFVHLLDQRFVAKRFQAGAAYPLGLAWLLMKVVGTPADLTITLYSDSAGEVGGEITHIHVPASRMADTLSEWLDEVITASLTLGAYYWLGISADAGDTADNHWEFAAKNAVGTTKSSADGVSWAAAAFDLYFRLTDAVTDKSAILYEYMEQQYVVVSGSSGAPRVFMNGDRGAADPNTGQLSKLIDATKSGVWLENQYAGSVVLITDGKGKDEPQPWRKIVSNTAGGELIVDEPFTIEHDNTTEYVILGSSTWRELTGHGMTSPVTSILVTTQALVLFAMGDDVNIRRHREWNNAGVWQEGTATEWADDGSNKARFLIYKPQANKIFRAQNKDATGDVSVSSADPVAWATASHTFSAATKVGSRYRRVTGLAIYPEDNGNEAVWVGKTDRPWIVPTTGNPYPMALAEMENVRSEKNFRSPLVENVYLYFPLGNGLERYYSGNLDDIGPNLSEGLPAGRQGAIVTMSGYPGKFFAAVDGGTSGYSALFDRDGNGWHERYRAPKGQRIKSLAHQVIPGSSPDRLWMYVGNDLFWLPFPSDTTNELEDPAYLYTHEGALILSHMHAGMFDVQKLVRLLKFSTSDLSASVCWLEIDYRLGEDAEWTTMGESVTLSPTQTLDLLSVLGLAAKDIQLRIRFYTSDASKTPVLRTVILDAVQREKVKYMYPVNFLVEDGALTLNNQGLDDFGVGIEKIRKLKDWADDSSDSLLLMNAISPLYDGACVFLNSPEVIQLQCNLDASKPEQKNVYVVKTSLQEA